MAEKNEQDFNRSGLTVCNDRVWYTGQRVQRIPRGLAGFVGVDCTSLDFSYNELSSVAGVKDFKRLQELILDNNDLRDLMTLPEMPHLTTLSLNNNKLLDIDWTLEKIRSCCPNVVYVSLLGNPGCPDQLTDPVTNDEDDYERYRVYAIYVLPDSLRFLDSRPVTRHERIQAKSRGQFLKIVRPDDRTTLNTLKPSMINEFDEVDFHVNYTPLPTATRSSKVHRVAYGKNKYQYSGKNSEGNRFICNNDL